MEATLAIRVLDSRAAADAERAEHDEDSVSGAADRTVLRGRRAQLRQVVELVVRADLLHPIWARGVASVGLVHQRAAQWVHAGSVLQEAEPVMTGR
jgi:hypothetical protein